MTTRTFAEKDKARFIAKTKLADSIRPGMETPCLEWTARKNRHGYGRLKLDGKMVLAHRLAWELEVGPIPDGMCALHRCDNPGCVNVHHLFIGTKADNSHDMVAKGRQAHGEEHSATLKRVASRGDANSSRRYPDRLERGEARANAKLTELKVRFVHEANAQGWSQSRISKELGVCPAMISRILSGKKWAHVRMAS